MSARPLVLRRDGRLVSIPSGRALLGQAAFHSLYATARVPASGVYVRVVAQNKRGHEDATELLLQFADESCGWYPRADVAPVL